MYRRSTSLIVVLLSLFLMHARVRAEGPSLREGEVFPDLRLPAIAGGESRAISSFRGKKLLLLVYASW